MRRLLDWMQAPGDIFAWYLLRKSWHYQDLADEGREPGPDDFKLDYAATSKLFGDLGLIVSSMNHPLQVYDELKR